MSTIKSGNSPVESVAGVIIKYQGNTIIDVVGVSNSPVHASVVADEFQATDKAPGVTYQSKTVKVYPERAI